MREVNYDDMKRMQADAERRVGEMNRQSRSVVERCNSKGGIISEERTHFTPVRDAPVPKNIKMPVEFPERKNSGGQTAAQNGVSEKPHFIYEPPVSPTRRTVDSKNGNMRTNIYGNTAFAKGLSKDDAERLFLLSLCMLLKSENADEGLITALMYIMT